MNTFTILGQFHKQVKITVGQSILENTGLGERDIRDISPLSQCGFVEKFTWSAPTETTKVLYFASFRFASKTISTWVSW